MQKKIGRTEEKLRPQGSPRGKPIKADKRDSAARALAEARATLLESEHSLITAQSVYRALSRGLRLMIRSGAATHQTLRAAYSEVACAERSLRQASDHVDAAALEELLALRRYNKQTSGAVNWFLNRVGARQPTVDTLAAAPAQPSAPAVPGAPKSALRQSSAPAARFDHGARGHALTSAFRVQFADHHDVRLIPARGDAEEIAE